MKKILLLSAFIISLSIAAQEKAVELNCYNKWAAKFDERGAEEVKDGIYEDVIITYRQGAKATCNSGKVEVRKGKIVGFWVLLSDGSHEEVKRSWKNNSNLNVGIVNGISSTMVTVYNELVNVLWPNLIKAKKAKPMAAPEPNDD